MSFARLVMITEGTEGDVNPFVAIADQLAQRGHSVALVTHGVYVKPYFRPNVQMHAFEADEEHVLFQKLAPLLNAPRTVPEVFRRYFFPAADRAVPVLRELTRGFDRVALVTNYTPGLAARVAAFALNVPLVTICTYPDNLRLAEITEKLISVHLKAEVADLLRRHGIKAGASEWWGQAQSRIALWPKWFYRHPEGDPTYAGFCWTDRIAEEAPDAPAEFSVFVTGGSASLATTEFFSAACGGCVEAGLSTVLATRMDGILDRLSSHIQPFREIRSVVRAIARARVVVHHGGMGTIGPSVHFKKPQLILAHGGDRPFNARLVEQHLHGRFLPRGLWSAHAVASELQELLAKTALPTDMGGNADPSKAGSVACDAIERAVCARQFGSVRSSGKT